jgi:hypothetical protein
MKRTRALLSIGVVPALYAFLLRRRMLRWGATDEEVHAPYPGADIVPGGKRGATMAVTIDSPAEDVWPWLVQLGGDRAGWYSWDHLDNMGRSSAKEIHPEWQQLAVGDHVKYLLPGGPVDAWEVAALEPNQFLGLHGLSDLRGRQLNAKEPRPSAYTEGLWGFQLKELPGRRTRLVIGGYQLTRPRWLGRLSDYWLYPIVVWIMQARMMAVLKRNVERVAAGERTRQVVAQTNRPAPPQLLAGETSDSSVFIGSSVESAWQRMNSGSHRRHSDA